MMNDAMISRREFLAGASASALVASEATARPLWPRGAAILSPGIPSIALTLNGQPITLNNQFITLKAS